MNSIERNRIEREYIKNAQVGDLFYCIPRYRAQATKLNVVRVTKTQLVLDNETRINKETGNIVGGDLYTPTYLPACPHVTAEMELADRKLKAKAAIKAAEEALQTRIKSLIADGDAEALAKMTEALEALLK
jgi:hypothetical protein